MADGERTTDRRADLAEQIARRRARARSAVPTGRNEAPLTEGQLRYWLGWRALPESLGRVVRRFEVHGAITPERLEAAVLAALERADGLRCSYPEVEGVPRQRVHPVDQVATTWHHPLGADQLRSVERDVEARAAQPIDLRTTLPTEVHLVACAPDHHRVVLLTHATAIDGWAEHLFVTWLQEACAGAGHDTGPRFVDLATWESEQQPTDARGLWRRMFDGVDRLDPWSELAGGTETRVEAHDLSPATVRSLLNIAEERGTTVFGVLLSAALLVLGDEWQLDRPLVDISTAGRTHPDAEAVVGRFSQLRPFSGDLRDDPAVSELIRRVGADLLAVLDAPRAPLHHMLAELPSRGRVTFRSVHVQYRSFPRPARPRGAPWVAPVDLRPEGQTALEISALPQPDGSLRIITRRTPRPQTDPAVDRAADRLLSMLVLLATRADVLDAPCSKAAALAAQVEHPALPDPDDELPRRWDATVLDRVRSTTAQRPSAIAVQAADVELTYAELAERAESLAAVLRARGLEPGQPVVVTGRRSAGLVVALLAVLEAGGVMVPLPDDLPDGAMAERAEVAGAHLGVVVGERSTSWLTATVRLGRDGGLDPADADADADAVTRSGRVPNVGPDAPAYVFFTSGTTGRARSVVGLHGSLCQFLDWQRSTFRIGTDDRVALVTSIGFDVVLRNVFLPLACGGTVVVAPDPLDPEDALGWVAESRITVLHVTPGLGRAWLQLHEGRDLPDSLRWTFFAGEPLSGELVDRWRGTLPAPGHVVNFYGPTETCMTRAAYCVPDVVEQGPVPVGWPVEGSQLLVVDDQGRRLGPGERGEVVVRTEHGTAGYGNAPALWAERAVAGALPGQVTYRTGDVGWYRPDGALVVQGRLDDEVKVGGVRVHPEDVAHRLRRLPGVAAAEVVADTTGPEVRLVAAVVPVSAAASRLDATAVRVALGEQVPAAAVPSSVLVLDRLPLTANGKVDRSALRSLAAPPATTDDDQAEPSAPDDTASGMVELWREVFPDAEVELDSDFFELGGHSLVTLRLIHRIRSRFGVELGLQAVFSADTPRAMADLVRSSSGTPASVPETARRVPITWQQEQSCELHELDPELARAPLVLGRLATPAMDVEALRGALALVAQRHDALRTTFDVASRELVIAPEGEVPLEVVDTGDPLPATDELRQRCVDAAGPGVDLDAPCLVHAKLLRFTTACDVLLLVAHHAVVDGVSIEVLADEIELAHRALIAGQQPELPPVTCTTADVVEHQRALASSGRVEEELAYWRSVLPSDLPRLEIPTDRPRDIRRSVTPGQCWLSLRPSDRRRLEALATAQGSTAYRVLAALWAAHVTELASVDEVVVGMPAMARDLPGSERMVGMFVTTLPLYLQVRGDDTVATLVARTTEVVRGAGRHRHPSLGRIRGLVRERWDPHHRPLFATSVNLIPHGPELPPDGEGHTWERLNVQADPLRVDLGLRCYTKGERLTRMVLRYDTDLFEHSTAERVLGTFVRLLRAVLDAPTSANVRDLQARVRHAEAPLPVHRRVAEHAREMPAHVAVEDGDRLATYAELDRRVNGLADELHAADVGPGALVGVHLDRGLDLVVAVLAVHRVGAGYVPLPLDLPVARLALVVDDTTPAAVIADRELPELPGLAANLPVVRIDRPGVTTTAPDAFVPADPDAIAYVIHTSGSTGRPKGTVIAQRSLSAFADVCRPLFGFCDADRVLLFHSLAFDSSVEEIFTTLGAGGTIVVPPVDLLGSVPHFLRFLTERRLTLLVLPTSFWHVLVRELEETDTPFADSVRLIIFGGQAAEPSAVHRWLARVPAEQVRLVNCYGPTEATVSVTSVHLTSDVMVPGEPTPIGRPHPGVEALVVDTDDREVGDGELGELLIAGDQVGEGYLGRPDLTAERFVELDARRWYRTGDLVRRRPDGLLVYHGRNDDQVKVRGFRIEPAEIDAALIDLPDVRDAFVLAETLVDGQEPVLVAHIEPVSGCHLDATTVRTALARVLPVHMVPGRVVLHERLPRTAGGKPDRLAVRDATPPHDVPVRFELTPAQAGLFFLELLRGDRAFQVIRVVHRVRGSLDVAALRAAVGSVVQRHDALRVRFGVDDGVPVQWVEPAPPGLDELVPFVDLSDAADPEGERHALLDEMLTRPFAVLDGALVRGVVVRTAPDEHTVALAIHHLVFDAGSRATLWRDLGDAYVAHVEGRPWTPPPSPLSYRDAVEARSRAAREGRERDLMHWRDALAGAPAAVALPPSPQPTTASAVARVSLGALRRDRLHHQAGVARTTPFVLVLTACAAALRDLTGHDDLVLGVPLNDRHLAGPATADTTGLMGLFVNTLPVRIQVPASASTAELVTSTRARVVAAMEHGAVSVAELVREVERGRERAGQAPFNVVVQLVHDPTDGSAELGGLPAERELWPAKGAKFDLSLTLAMSGDDLRLQVDRAGAVLGDERTAELVDLVTRHLDALCDAPDLAHAQAPPVDVAHPVGPTDPAGASIVDGLLDAWRTAFDDPAYGPDDDFFSAGGHSLLAVRLLSLIERATGHDVPVLTLFDHPTPRQLAALLAPGSRLPETVTPVAPARVAPAPPTPQTLAPRARVEAPPRLHLDRAPLSFAQERFWLLRQLGENDLYQIPRVWRLAGRFDRAALDAALASVVTRHEILRTRYLTYDDGTPYQLIDPPGPVPIERFDVRRGSPDDVDRAWERLRRPFDLSAEWPVRVGLLQVADQEHHLVLSVHHIAGDAATHQQLWGEVREAYVGGAVDRCDLPFQYADLAVWERAQLAAASGPEADPASPLAAALQHWRERLAELPEPFVLPGVEGVDDPERAVVERATAGADVARGVRDVAARLSITPAAVVLAAAGLSLCRTTGRDEVVIGVPVSTRSLHDEAVIGPFLNTLPIRVRLVDGETAGDLMRRVGTDLAAALEHRAAPFEVLARAAGTRHERWDTALTPVVVNLFDGERTAGSVDMGGLRAEPLAPPPRLAHHARFAMTLTARLGSELTLGLERRAEVSPEVSFAWTAGVESALRAFTLDSESPLASVSTLHPDTERWLRDGLNRTARPFPADRTVDELVADQVAARPRHIAVVDGAARLTYEALSERAAGREAALRQCEVRQGDRVGVALDRSIELVVTLLACARLGAVYVPVEVSQPAARSERILDDAGAVAVVSEDPGRGVLVESREGGSRSASTGDRCSLDPAYVMYTSGSTGAPKGVVVPHRAIARLVCNTDELQLGPDDVVALASNPAFDAVTWEVWGALVNGATLVVLDRETVLSPEGLHAALEAHGVTAMFMTTALFHVMAAERPGMFAGLRALLFGGEVCDAGAVRRVLDAGGPQRLLHVYGPTESTTFACWYPVEAVAPGATTLPIGLPITNTTAHVLDAHGRLVPPGVAGELYLGGAGLALGYLGDAELTAERFVPDPWSTVPDARLYRTGDVVRRRADGEIEFVGRVDRQVKVRGYRVQPEEVELALATHPSVRSAVVDVVTGPAGAELVAVAEADEDDVTVDELRAHLAALLPSNMVPTSLAVVSSLPVTANGKVDRVRARELAQGAREARETAGSAADVAGVDGPVARIWAEVLGLDRPDPDATFFELGGHSLRAVQLFTRLRRELGVDLPLSTLFAHATLRSLAARVEQEHPGSRRAGAVASAHKVAARVTGPGTPELVVLREGHGPPVVLVHPAGGQLFQYAHLAPALPPGREVVGLAADMGSGGRWPSRVEDAAERNLAVLRHHRPGGPYVLGGLSSGGLIAFEMARQLRAAGEEVDGLLLFDPTRLHGRWWRGGRAGARRHWRPRAVKKRAAKAARQLRALVRVKLGRLLRRPTPTTVVGTALLGHHRRMVRRYRALPAAAPVPTVVVLAEMPGRHTVDPSADRQRWQHLTGAVPEVVVVRARHAGPGSLLQPPHVAEVASAVSHLLDGSLRHRP